MINLPYSQLSDVMLYDYDSIDDISLNKILTKFIANDLYITPYSNIFPEIWERKWFNNDNIQGYKKGDAIWYNTENKLEFIQFNSSKIYSYAKVHPYLCNIIKPFVANNPEIYSLYQNIVDGYTDSQISLPRLFDFGDLSAIAKIKISTIDNNKAPVSDSLAWDNFLIDNKSSGLSSSIETIVDSIISAHIETHHLGSLSSATEVQLKKYLSKDLKNIEPLQNQTNNNWLVDSRGFDFVTNFTELNLEDSQTKWFRLWNSGLLEHGGCVTVTSSDIANNYIPVDFIWTYSSSLSSVTTSPEYTYALNDKSFYGNFSKLDTGAPYINTGTLSETTRYTVSIAPRFSSETPDLLDNLQLLPNVNTEHPLNEIYELKNSGFKIKLLPNSSVSKYSYYVKGFRTNNV